MKPSLVLAAILAVSAICFSQDLKVREEAEGLLERANAVSSSPKLPNLERVDTFRVFGDSGIKEGRFTRLVIQGVGRRDEYNFSDYDLVNVWTQKQVAVAGTPHLLPPELVDVLRITPIYLLTFDGQDVIRGFTDRDLNGRAAHCIEFDTIHGGKTESNELCVDATSGTLVLERVSGGLVENSDFFPFAGALMPGKIRYSVGGVQKMEITQTMTALAGSEANVLAAPPNSSMHRICTTSRRAFGVSMPQPKPGNGGETAEIVVRGMVGADGKLYDATVQTSERPDLNAEALELAKQWRFIPPTCDGHPDAQDVDFTLQFQGR